MAIQDLSQLKTDIADTLWNGTLADHQDVADQLMAYLTGAGRDMARTDAAQYDALVKQWVLLSFGAFVILPNDEQQDLLKTRLLVAIQAGYTADDFVQQFFDMYESDEFLAPIFIGFANLLQQNTETLGSASLDLAGAKYLPQIRYWLLDYAKSPSQSARRTSIDRLNYVNTSANARQLTQVQRSQLLEILKLQDLLGEIDRPAEKYRAPDRSATPAQPAPAQPVPPRQPAPELTPSSVAEISAALEASLAARREIQKAQQPPVQQPPAKQPQPPKPPQPPVPPQKDLPRGLPVDERDLPAPRPQPQPQPKPQPQPPGSLESVMKNVVAAHVEAPVKVPPQPQPKPQIQPQPPSPVQLSPSAAAGIGNALAASLVRQQQPRTQPQPKPQPTQAQPTKVQPPPQLVPIPQFTTKMAQPKLKNYSPEAVQADLIARLKTPQDFAALTPQDFHYDHPEKVFAAVLARVAELSRAEQPWMIIESIESSPLYQAYIDSGRVLLEDQNADTSKYDMSKDEFEAFADFRKSLGAIG